MMPGTSDPVDPVETPCDDDAPLLFAVVNLVVPCVPPPPSGSHPDAYHELYNVVRGALGAAHRNKTGHDLDPALLTTGASTIAQAYVDHGWNYPPPKYQVQALIESKYDEAMLQPHYLLAKPRDDDAPLLFAVVEVASAPALIPPPPATVGESPEPAELIASVIGLAGKIRGAVKRVFPANVTELDVSVASAKLLAAYVRQLSFDVVEGDLAALLGALRAILEDS